MDAGDGPRVRITRHYQDYICSIAQDKNVIACLPTGSGKTYIACLLMRHYASQIVEPFSGSGKRIFFLVPQKVLVSQQADEIRKFSSFPEDVAELTGDNDTDSWTAEKWTDHLTKFRIFVMIHDIFLNLLSMGNVLPLNKISVIVFDEAHHAALKQKSKMTNHPYRRILQKLSQHPATDNPIRILGLTASLINNRISTKEQLRVHVMDLEEAFLGAECVIVNTDEVYRYKTNAKLIMWLCEESGSLIGAGSNELRDLCHSMSLELKQRHKKFHELKITFPIDCDDAGKIMDRLWKCTTEMSMWISRELCREYLKELEQSLDVYENSYVTYAAVLRSLMAVVREINRNLSNQLDYLSEKDQIVGISSSKLIRLLQLLENYSLSAEQFRGIIFVETRLEAKAFAHWIQKASTLMPTLSFIRAQYMIGYSSRPGFVDKISRLSRQHQEETMKAFRDGKLNLLIATSVLEEGLDVPECNCVIRYHLPATYRSYQQSMGRARARDAAFYLIASVGKEEVNLSKDVTSFEELGQEIIAICKQNKRRREVKQGLARKDLSSEQEERMNTILEAEKVVHPVTGAEVAHGSAVSRVHEYLAQTSFGWVPRPDNNFVPTGDGSFCEVRLPLCSGIPDVIQGSNMSNEWYAKKSAYLRIVRQLMDRVLLDEHLKPMPKQVIVDRMLKQLKLEVPREQHVSGDIIPGTKKRKQAYAIADPDRQLKSSSPSTQFFLYVILIDDPATPAGDHVLGLLSVTELPRQVLIPLTLYKKNRSVTVSMHFVKRIELSPDSLNLVTWFHEFVFIAMLDFESKMNEIGGDGSVSQLICPIPRLNVQEIDFAYIESLKWKEDHRAPLLFKEDGFAYGRAEEFVFDPSVYPDAVVRHWYGPVSGFDKPIQHMRSWSKSWRVIGIELTLNDWIPNDNGTGEVPSSCNQTFAQYYRKYHLTATVPTQKLLKVAPGAQVALLTPNETTRSLTMMHYVPEFVEICPMSGNMWEKVSCLPAFLHRLRQLRLAHQFSRLMANTAHVDINPDECFDHLKFASAPLAVRVRGERGETLPEDQADENGNSVPAKRHSEESEEEDSTDDDQSKHLFTDFSAGGDVIFERSDTRTFTQRLCQIARRNFDDGIRRPVVFKPDQMFVNNKPFQSAVPLVRPVLNFIHGMQTMAQTCEQMMENLKNCLTTAAGSASADCAIQLQHPEPGRVLRQNDAAAFSMVSSFDSQPESRSFPPGLFIEVMSAKQAHDVINSERLETLGDSFLKFAVSSYLHARASDRSPNAEILADSLSEGHLTMIKGQLVSNFNLYRLAKNVKVGDESFANMMFVRELVPKENWLPPGFCETQGKNKRTTQAIDDKKIADSIEALVGAVVLTLGDVEAIKLLSWLGLPVTLGDHLNLVRGQQWLPAINPVSADVACDAEFLLQEKIFYDRSNIQRLEKILNYSFRNKWFAISAMTHSSCCDNWITGSYEKLEFLGDAVLDRLMATFCFQYKRSDGTRLDPGEMTDLRSALVNNAYLGCVLVKFDLHKSIFLTAHELKNQIDTCADNLTVFALDREDDKPHLTIGSYLITKSEDESGTLSLKQMEVPKILGDVLEALLGAIFLDSGRSLDAVWRIVYGLMESELTAFVKDIPRNPIRLIYEADPGHKFFDAKHPDNENSSFQIKLLFKQNTYTGTGRSLRFARLHAAMNALSDTNDL